MNYTISNGTMVYLLHRFALLSCNENIFIIITFNSFFNPCCRSETNLKQALRSWHCFIDLSKRRAVAFTSRQLDRYVQYDNIHGHGATSFTIFDGMAKMDQVFIVLCLLLSVTSVPARPTVVCTSLEGNISHTSVYIKFIFFGWSANL